MKKCNLTAMMYYWCVALTAAVLFMTIHGKSVGAQTSAVPPITAKAYLNPALRGRTNKLLEQAAQATAQGTPAVTPKKPAAYKKAIPDSQEHSDLHTGLPAQIDSPVNPAEVAKRYQQAHADGPGLYIFVSLSLPAASLQRIAREAQKTGAALLLRGLTDNSVKKTIARLKHYSQKGITFHIDPESYARFGVNVVPSYILALQSAGCQSTQCQIASALVEGDVSLGHALQAMQRNTTNPQIAQRAQALQQQLEGRFGAR